MRNKSKVSSRSAICQASTAPSQQLPVYILCGLQRDFSTILLHSVAPCKYTVAGPSLLSTFLVPFKKKKQNKTISRSKTVVI